MRLRWSISINVVSMGGAGIVGFVATVALARLLPPREFALLTFALVVFNAIGVIDGLRPVVVFLTHQPDICQSSLRQVLFRLFSAIGAFAIAAIFLLGFIFLRRQVDIATMMLFAISCGLYFPLSYYWGILDANGQTWYTGFVRALGWIFCYIALVLVATLGGGPIGFALCLMTLNLVLIITCRMREPPAVFQPSNRPKNVVSTWHCLRLSINNVLTNLGAVTLNIADRFLAPSVVGLGPSAPYAAFSEIATKPAVLFRVVAAVIYPWSVRRVVDNRASLNIFLELLWAMFFALEAIALTIAAFRAPVAHALFGAKYAADADLLLPLILALPFGVFGYGCPVILNSHGNFQTQRRVYLTGAAIAIGILIFGAVQAGIYGIAWGYLGTRFTDVALALVAGRLTGVTFPKSIWGLSVLTASGAIAAYSGYRVAAVLASFSIVMALSWVIGMHVMRSRTRA